MRTYRLGFLLVSATALLSGCMTYRYGDKTYQNRDEAEVVAAKDQRGLLEKFEPLKELATKKSMRCMMMTKEQLKERGIFGSGNADSVDYVATVYFNDYQNMCDLLSRRNIFGKVTKEFSDGDHVTPKDDVVIYLYTPDKSRAGWYYSSKKIKTTPLHFDSANPDKYAKVKYFVDSVEALASSE